jgi:hypothetical protein
MEISRRGSKNHVDRTTMIVATLGLMTAACGEAPRENVERSTSNLTGNTYYVSSSTGADSNSGTSELQPWKTLDAVYLHRASLAPGDKVLLKRGDTFGRALLLKDVNGAADAPITIGAYGSGSAPKPVISAGGAVLDWEPVTTHPGCARARIAEENHIDGNSVNRFFYQDAFVAELQATVSPNSNLAQYLNQMLAASAWGPRGNPEHIYFCRSDLAGLSAAALKSHLLANVRAFSQGIVITNSSHLMAEDIEVNQAYQAVAIVRSHHVTLRRFDTRNTIHFAVNLVTESCPDPDDPNAPNDPVSPWPCSSHIAILDSSLKNSVHNAVYALGVDHLRISGSELGPFPSTVIGTAPGCCAAPNGDLNAIGVENGSNILIDHNFIHDTVAGEKAIDIAAIGSVELGSAIDHVSVHHNFVANTTGLGTLMGSNLSVHHNIFVAPPNADLATRKRLNGVDIVGRGSGRSTVYNNVFYGVAHEANAGIKTASNTDDGPVFVLNNVVVAVQPTSTFKYLRYEHPLRTYSRNNAFFALPNNTVPFPDEPHSFQVNPGFVSATPTTPADFELSASSPLIDAGVDPKLTSALDPWDVGRAFEMAGAFPAFDATWGKAGQGLDIGAYERSGGAATSLASGVILAQHFDEKRLSDGKPTLVDASGFNYHGVPSGGVGPSVGQLDGAIELDGVDSKIEYGNLGSWNPVAFSVSFWMKSNGVGSGGTPRILARKLTLDYFPNTDKLKLEVGASTQNGSATTESLTEGVWHHVVCTYDDSGQATGDRKPRIYVDGVLNVNATTHQATTGSLVSQASQSLLVGKHTSQANYFKGQLDELTIWNRVLTTQEIATLYNLGTGSVVDTAPDLPILGKWSPNFLLTPPADYGFVVGATAAVGDKGATLALSGSGWKRVLLSYTVTPNTRLGFWFRSSGPGAIQGIGLDSNDLVDVVHTFQLYGSSTFGHQDHHDYAEHASNGWHHYDIAVGQKFTGAMTRIFFANEGAGAVAEFSSVHLYEAP